MGRCVGETVGIGGDEVAAIDLLFDVKRDSERLHQLVLGPLLIRTRLLEKLGIGGVPKRDDFEWEPRGRAFDLAVELTTPEATHVWVEMKVDGSLTKPQVQKQVQAVQAKQSDSLLYILLGHSQLTSALGDVDEILRSSLPGRYQIVTGRKLCDALEHPDILLGTSEHDRDVRDLATTYLNWLRVLLDRYSHFSDRGRSYRGWGAGDCYGFFCWCRDQLGVTDMGMNYVPNPRGGFFGSWWEWHECRFRGELNRIYLQFEFAPWDGRSLLRLKVEPAPARPELWAPLREETWKRISRHSSSPNLGVARPARMGSGSHVTVAVIDLKLDTATDLPQTLEGIPALAQGATRIVQDVSNSYRDESPRQADERTLEE